MRTRFELRIEPEDKARWDKAAQEERLNLSGFVRAAVSDRMKLPLDVRIRQQIAGRPRE